MPVGEEAEPRLPAPSERARSSPSSGAIGAGLRPASRTAKSATSSFSVGPMEQVAYTSRPPGLRSAANRRTRVRWMPAKRAGSSGPSRQRASGLRRRVPSPLHGASTRTTSAFPARSCSSASASGPAGIGRARRLCTPARRARRRASSRRSASESSAWSDPLFRISAASARAFPPAPAHASTTVQPGRAPHASAMSWLPSSWISNIPARKDGSENAFSRPSRTRPHGDQRVGSAFTPSPARRPRSSPRSPASAFARIVRGARSLSARPSTRASSTPSCAANRAAIQRGSDASSESRSTGSTTAAIRASAASSAASRVGATPSRRAASAAGTPPNRASHAAYRSASPGRPPRSASSCPCQRTIP